MVAEKAMAVAQGGRQRAEENRKVTSKELRGDENYFSRGPLLHLPSLHERRGQRTLKNPCLRNYFRFLLFIPSVES